MKSESKLLQLKKHQNNRKRLNFYLKNKLQTRCSSNSSQRIKLKKIAKNCKKKLSWPNSRTKFTLSVSSNTEKEWALWRLIDKISAHRQCFKKWIAVKKHNRKRQKKDSMPVVYITFIEPESNMMLSRKRIPRTQLVL